VVRPGTIRRKLWPLPEARNKSVPALKGGVGSKKIVFYTNEATNLVKTKEET
jgi:hypothetical protein